MLKKPLEFSALENKSSDEVVEYISNLIIDEYNDKIKDIPKEIANEFEKAISLRVIDIHWMEQINTMSHLREGIQLRGYGQENPLRAYTNEGFELFDELLSVIDKDITNYLLKAEIRQNIERKQVAKGQANDGGKVKNNKPKHVQKIGRNAPCPCGSGKKYKNCCGK